jgi:hypothetical protein
MNMPFAHRENIVAFRKAIAQLGVPDADAFETDDLYEAKNLKQVLQCLESLGRTTQTVKGYNGPSFGVKLAEKNIREDFANKDRTTTFFEKAYTEIGKDMTDVDQSYRTGKPNWGYDKKK